MSKILVLDCETSPAKVYVWGLFQQNVSLPQIIEPSRILCVAAKFVGEKGSYFFAEWNGGRKAMLEGIHKLMLEADAIVTYNGDGFDLKRLEGEFLLEGLPPTPTPTSIDLLKAVKKLGFQSNKLAYVGPALRIGAKVAHSGFSLWVDVMNGDPKARAKMEKYCRGDTYLTEQLYKKLKPFLRNHPTLGDTKKDACPSCGSDKVQNRGFRRTKAFKIQRRQCVSCGAWHNGARSKV